MTLLFYPMPFVTLYYITFPQLEGVHPHHMLQHAIRLQDYRLVDILMDAGADVNMHVQIREYFRVRVRHSLYRGKWESTSA